MLNDLYCYLSWFVSNTENIKSYMQDCQKTEEYIGEKENVKGKKNKNKIKRYI